jgi:hypothetical protein
MPEQDVISNVSTRQGGSRLLDRLNLAKVSWGAIWAGVMVTIGMEALFLSFGICINAAFGGSVVWSTVWYLVTMAVSFCAGAWCAARLSDSPVREVSILHGITTWGLATLATGIIFGAIAWVRLWMGTIAMIAGAAPPFTWGATLGLPGVIWGGIILALGAAYFGGAAGLPTPRAGVTEEAPGTPLRRVS